MPQDKVIVPDNLDLEANMTSTESAWDDTEDENDLAGEIAEMEYGEFTPQTAASEEEEDEEEQEEEESLFNDDAEDEQEEEGLTAAELEAFNKKLGTNFKSAEELKANFQKEETQTEQQKEDAELQTLSNRVKLFDNYIQMEDKELVRNQFISDARVAGKDINNQDVLDEIEEKIQGSEDLGTLATLATTLRSNLSNAKNNAQQGVDAINSKRQQSQQQTAQQNVASLQTAFADILTEGEFMGIAVDKKILSDVYKKVRSEEFFNSVNNDQRKIARLALFDHLEEEFKKGAKTSAHSDEVKNAFNFLAGSGKGKARTIAQAKNGSASGNGLDNIAAFLK